MKCYKKPARRKRHPVGLYGKDKPLPERPTVLVAKRGEVPLSSDAGVANLMPAVFAKVRYGTYRQRRSWKRQAHHFGCAFRVVQGFAEGGATCERDDCITAVLEVWGAGEALASLMNSELVLRWEYRVGVARDNPTSLGHESRPAAKAKRGKYVPHPPAVFLSKDEVLRRG